MVKICFQYKLNEALKSWNKLRLLVPRSWWKKIIIIKKLIVSLIFYKNYIPSKLEKNCKGTCLFVYIILVVVPSNLILSIRTEGKGSFNFTDKIRLAWWKLFVERFCELRFLTSTFTWNTLRLKMSVLVARLADLIIRYLVKFR